MATARIEPGEARARQIVNAEFSGHGYGGMMINDVHFFQHIHLSPSNIANLQSDRVITPSIRDQWRGIYFWKNCWALIVHTVVVSGVGETSFASLEVGRRKSITKAQTTSHVGILYHVAGVVMSVKHASWRM